MKTFIEQKSTVIESEFQHVYENSKIVDNEIGHILSRQKVNKISFYEDFYNEAGYVKSLKISLSRDHILQMAEKIMEIEKQEKYHEKDEFDDLPY